MDAASVAGSDAGGAPADEVGIEMPDTSQSLVFRLMERLLAEEEQSQPAATRDKGSIKMGGGEDEDDEDDDEEGGSGSVAG